MDNTIFVCGKCNAKTPATEHAMQWFIANGDKTGEMAIRCPKHNKPAEIFAAYNADFTWDAKTKTWCLSGVDRRGNVWETDDFDAPNKKQAEYDAVDYLQEFHT